MSKIILITLSILTLSGCYNQIPTTDEHTRPQGAIITEEGAIIFYHNIWGDIKRNMGME
jgi:hypothetical protein